MSLSKAEKEWLGADVETPLGRGQVWSGPPAVTASSWSLPDPKRPGLNRAVTFDAGELARVGYCGRELQDELVAA